MRTLRKNSPGQVEWNGGSTMIHILRGWTRQMGTLWPDWKDEDAPDYLQQSIV